MPVQDCAHCCEGRSASWHDDPLLQGPVHDLPGSERAPRGPQDLERSLIVRCTARGYSCDHPLIKWISLAVTFGDHVTKIIMEQPSKPVSFNTFGGGDRRRGFLVGIAAALMAMPARGVRSRPAHGRVQRETSSRCRRQCPSAVCGQGRCCVR